MNYNDRQIIESPLYQGEDERIPYTLTTTPWGSSPTSPAVVVKLESDLSDVTATVIPSGSASVAGDVITLPIIRNLTTGVRYRLEIQFTIGTRIQECWGVLIGQE
jgi:hypothetical protein